ncbi:3493_t:CDS:2 [Diversispora eburnea]|uniref:Cofilin n=1 Tax=Diversispora eburnea TaxID=1213867 RepID=A0A9N9AEY7_9GLOM|nr:3493_t:CDS:2 [Diversispora eburnea]
MASGVEVNDECVKEYELLKHKKAYKYITFKISDNHEQINIEKKVQDGTYEEFVACLPENEPRYAVYDFEYEKPGEGHRSKIVFYSWIPDTARIKPKMIYASSKEAFRKKLNPSIEIQGTDFSEVSFEAVLEKAIRTS